jgi:sigma-B regulation protein RsbU (phosphoserine phosphatase)
MLTSAEKELVRLNRALRALSLCNEALMRATDESAYLNKVCQIIVEEAGYRFCWVAKAEHDAEKRVTAVAQAGVDDGYLAAVQVTWADSGGGLGPTGTCIRTGQRQLIRNTATDTRFNPGRAEALKRGYASIIAIPLTVKDVMFGALSMYGSEPDDFPDEEVKLLTDLADDLGFGVTMLRARVEQRETEAEIYWLNAELERRVLERTAHLEAALEREAAIGVRIQQMLLLAQPPADVHGIEVAALTLPSKRFDGDFYDFFAHQGDCLDVVVADVMGKGIPAALLAAATKCNVLEALCHLTAMNRDGLLPEPKEIVTLAHADMVRQLIDLESFVTLSYARIDLKQRRVDLVDCGHTGMIVLHARTGSCEVVSGDNLPLGVRDGEIFDQVTAHFEPGDLFLFYSDGLTEIRNEAGELYGPERLLRCMRINRALEPDALVEAIRDAATAFGGDTPLADDLTCVVVKVTETPRPLVHVELEITSDIRNLRQARAFVRDCCRLAPQGFQDDDIAALELAVNEAASNIMKHAHRGRPDQRIYLDGDMYPDRVSIQLHYVGDPFTPSSAPRPALDGSRESGFGMYLMSRSVDEIRYFRDDRGRNCIALVKRRRPGLRKRQHNGHTRAMGKRRRGGHRSR